MIGFLKFDFYFKISSFISTISTIRNIVLAFVLALSLVVYAYSQEVVKGGVPQARKTILDFKEELKLNEKQVKEIEKYLQGFFKKEQELSSKIREKEARFKEMLNSDWDIKEIKKLVKEIHCLRGELIAEELETGKKIDGVLNEEQRKKWREIRIGRR
ncbi:Spy/CpxP family protein refolding chaperone [Thermodesulfobacterium sp. TA1]|uniref:Spy/CpxP family protein refolding chaperone n=1 Tax=Thermodesulfobacterium sp. TA1 TaxID=2234087 RepID=UPI001F0EB4C4|nr:Spy/CpxP family protein refolding chaperone [Thermodesulfobacterium sp. TA1]